MLSWWSTDATPASVLGAANDFDVLGLPIEWASRKLIISARRRISLTVHPDRACRPSDSGCIEVATQAMQRVNNAKDRLLDPLSQLELGCD